MSSLSGLKCPLPPTSRLLVTNRILIILMIMMIVNAVLITMAMTYNNVIDDLNDYDDDEFVKDL